MYHISIYKLYIDKENDMSEDEFSSFEELNSLVSERDDVVTVVMHELRDAFNVKKLGKHVVEDISFKYTP